MADDDGRVNEEERVAAADEGGDGSGGGEDKLTEEAVNGKKCRAQ